jgi:hypothetical protein
VKMVPVCLFSALNHPPHRDFIKHLPHSKGDSERLGGRVQAYSFWASPNPNEPPIQTGASPDRTKDRWRMGRTLPVQHSYISAALTEARNERSLRHRACTSKEKSPGIRS